MKLNKLAFAALLTLSLAACAKETKQPIDAYPPAQQNFDRFVFYLPTLADETTRKVELIVGKTQTVDCNTTALNGVLEERSVEGWGYPYFIVEKIDGAMSTLMACPPGSPTTEQFVSLGGDNQLQRYNSKLPIVVYVPNGYEVRYRIWATGTKTFSAIDQSREDVISISAPLAGSVVTSPLSVKGSARGNWFFEGDFPVALEDKAGNIISRSYVSAEGDWMTTDFVAFKGSINFTVAEDMTEGYLVFEKDNPSDRRELDDAARIPVLFKR